MRSSPHLLACVACFWAASASGVSDAGMWCVDRSFADGGLFVQDVGGVANVGFTAQGLSLQDDGRLVLGGIGGAAPRFGFAILRLRDDGSLDDTFGDGGLVEYELGGFDHSLETVEVQPDGTVVIAGSLDEMISSGANVLSTVVARLLPDGRLDPAFGGLGVVHPRYGLGTQLVNAQVRVRGGNHRLAGQCRPFASPGAINLCVIGLRSDGSADLAFGDAGLVEFDLGGSDDFGGVLTLDAAGRLLVPSTSYSPSAGFDFGLARLLPSGELDSSFTDDAGRPGRVTTDFFAGGDACTVVLEQPDGLIVCAGSATAADGGGRFALARYLPSGKLDPSFGGSGGKLAFDFGAPQGARTLAVLPDGTLAVGGFATGDAGDQDFVVAFLDSTGTLRQGYGQGGLSRFDVSAGRDDAVHTLRVDGSGRLLLFGEAGNDGGNDLAVLRLGPCTPDAGPPDAGPPDAGSSDAGPPDAGSPDAGSSDSDAGSADAGAAESPAPRALRVGCGCFAPGPAPWVALLFAWWARRRRSTG